MNEEEILDQQDYEGDFWSGFVDILSGLVLIFSFLILVAGIIIAVIYQTFSTVKIPPEPYKFVLTTIQQSPLTIFSQYDVIEDIEKRDKTHVLVNKTRQKLESVGQKAHQILANYPILERRLVQEIRFLQEEISPPPEGETQQARDFKGGRNNLSGADNIPPAEVNWDTVVDGQEIFISFDKADSSPPQGIILDKLRNTLRNWTNNRPKMNTIQLLVANAVTPYRALAQKDALKRALLIRNLLRNLRYKFNVKIISAESGFANHSFGWIRVREEK